MDEKLTEIAKRYNVARVYALTVVVDDVSDEKATAYFGKPSMDVFSAALSIQQRDPMKAKVIILKRSFLEGDKRVIETDTGLMNAALHVDEIINLQKGDLKKN